MQFFCQSLYWGLIFAYVILVEYSQYRSLLDSVFLGWHPTRLLFALNDNFPRLGKVANFGTTIFVLK